MATKKTTKSSSKKNKVSDKKEVLNTENKKDSNKKVVVKRRKVDLVPTKASAVAIASQASRAKKQALIERVASSEIPYKRPSSSDTKIPLWVRMFFWCSLLLLCVSFYKAMIYPQLEKNNEFVDQGISWVDENVKLNDDELVIDENTDIDNEVIWSDNLGQNEIEDVQWLNIPENAKDTIAEFFNRLSDRNFDDAFELMIPVLRNSSEIKEHFTAFRMNPFLDWIEWWRLTPTNFQYIKSPSFWKDVYNFDLLYVLNSDQSEYEETWEFTVNTQWDFPRISSIRCVTPKCSYHPIFWPENFGLMR